MRNVYATVKLDIVRSDLRTTDLPALCREWGLFSEAQEVVWVVTYDPMAQLRSVIEVARGSQFRVEVDVSTVLQAAWAAGTSRFQLMHNHPSGKLNPTKVDLDLTQQVYVAALAGQMYLEDHIVIGPPDGWWSMADHKQFEAHPKIRAMYARAAVGGPVFDHREPR